MRRLIIVLLLAIMILGVANTYSSPTYTGWARYAQGYTNYNAGRIPFKLSDTSIYFLKNRSAALIYDLSTSELENGYSLSTYIQLYVDDNGYRYIGTVEDGSIYLWKYDSSGNLIWSRRYNASFGGETFYDMYIEAFYNNKLYIAVGTSDDNYDGLLVVDAQTGAVSAYKVITLSDTPIYIYNIRVDSDGIYIVGDIYSISNDAYYLILLKMDSSYSIVKAYNVSDTITYADDYYLDIWILSDKVYVVFDDFDNGYTYIMILDKNLNTVATKRISITASATDKGFSDISFDSNYVYFVYRYWIYVNSSYSESYNYIQVLSRDTWSTEKIYRVIFLSQDRDEGITRIDVSDEYLAILGSSSYWTMMHYPTQLPWLFKYIYDRIVMWSTGSTTLPDVNGVEINESDVVAVIEKDYFLSHDNITYIWIDDVTNPQPIRFTTVQDSYIDIEDLSYSYTTVSPTVSDQTSNIIEESQSPPTVSEYSVDSYLAGIRCLDSDTDNGTDNTPPSSRRRRKSEETIKTVTVISIWDIYLQNLKQMLKNLMMLWWLWLLMLLILLAMYYTSRKQERYTVE